MLSHIRAALQPPARGRRDAGIISLYMALVVTFALVAVIELTRIWFGARDIDDNVGTVNTRLDPIEQNTSQIALLMKTTSAAGQIEESTRPLSEQATEVNQTVTDINNTARSIQDTAVTINGRVGDITATVQEINATADELTGTVNSIQANANSINGRFAELLPVVRQIETGDMGQWPRGIGNINKNADVVIRLARDIRADLNNVRGSVIAIDQSAASIEESVLISPIDLGNSMSLAGSPLPGVGGLGNVGGGTGEVLPNGGNGGSGGNGGVLGSLPDAGDFGGLLGN